MNLSGVCLTKSTVASKASLDSLLTWLPKALVCAVRWSVCCLQLSYLYWLWRYWFLPSGYIHSRTTQRYYCSNASAVSRLGYLPVYVMPARATIRIFWIQALLSFVIFRICIKTRIAFSFCLFVNHPVGLFEIRRRLSAVFASFVRSLKRLCSRGWTLFSVKIKETIFRRQTSRLTLAGCALSKHCQQSYPWNPLECIICVQTWVSWPVFFNHGLILSCYLRSSRSSVFFTLLLICLDSCIFHSCIYI